MSLTLDDIDGLSSDSDDEEYVPEGGGLSSDNSESEGDYAPLVSEDGKSASQVTTKARLKKTRTRKRKARGKRSKVTVPVEASEEDSDGREESEDKEQEEKARIDDLWTSFKQDTTKLTRKPSDNQGKDTADEPRPPKRLKIQKTYDFAGEDVVVEKEVSADSKEAKKYLESCAESATISSKASAGTASLNALPLPTPPGKSQAERKKSSGLSSVLKSLGKKAKMSTLEKSSMDWTKFKSENGLEEELARNSKDGYLARQEFLQWSDQKQFELEKNERLKRFRRLH